MHTALTWFLRLFFAAVLVVSSVGKLLDNRGFAQVIGTYQLGIPERALLPLALIFSLGELALGVAVLCGIQLRQMSAATIALHVFYLTLASATLLRGLQLANCGCFGVFWVRPLDGVTVVEDVVLTLLSVGFWLCVRREPASRSLRSAQFERVG